MKRTSWLIALLLSILLTGCQGGQNSEFDSLQSQIEELRTQFDSNFSEMDMLRSQVEEAQKQLEDANAVIAELQAELDEAIRQIEEDRSTILSPAGEESALSGDNATEDSPSSSMPSANPPPSNGVVKVDLQGLSSGVSDSSLNDSDKECIGIIEASGTWGPAVTRLFPSMTKGGVEKVISIYLEHQLFPGITTASGAEQIATRIEVALPYMSEDAQAIVNNILAEFV